MRFNGLPHRIERMPNKDSETAQDATTVRLSQATIDGMTVAYRSMGGGPPVVLLHGLPGLAGLASAARCDVGRLHGHRLGCARSREVRRPARAVHHRRLGGLSRVVPRRARVDPAAIVGLSWGGPLAQELYRRHPARVTTLVLADTYAGGTGSLGPAVATERLTACVRDSVLPPQEFVPRYLPGMFGPAPTSAILEELATIMAARILAASG